MVYSVDQMGHERTLLIAGSGYLGGVTTAWFCERGWRVRLLSRSVPRREESIEHYAWDGVNQGEWRRALEGVDVVLNLCGKSVRCRSTGKNREEILRSRVDTTESIGRALAEMSAPPKVWINASGVDFYRESSDVAMTEENLQAGEDFMAQVCVQWEDAQRKWQREGVRQVALRISMVLGNHPGSAFTLLKQLARCGLGGTQGSGRQYVSWIHELDFVRAIEFLVDTELSGPINFCAPQSLPNADFMRILRQYCRIGWGLPTPAWAIRVGGALFGPAPDLVLKSRHALPEKLLQAGFRFEYADYVSACRQLLA
jgi:uncharacterized protein (TIGR01777 family)